MPDQLFVHVLRFGKELKLESINPGATADLACADCVEDGAIPVGEADNSYISVDVFIHWEAEDDDKIQGFNYEATKLATKSAINRERTAADVVAEKSSTAHPYAAHV